MLERREQYQVTRAYRRIGAFPRRGEGAENSASAQGVIPLDVTAFQRERADLLAVDFQLTTKDLWGWASMYCVDPNANPLHDIVQLLDVARTEGPSWGDGPAVGI